MGLGHGVTESVFTGIGAAEDGEWDGEAEVIRLYGSDWMERNGVMFTSADFCPGLEAGRMICTICHAQLLSHSTVLSHFESKKHRRWLAWHNAEYQAKYGGGLEFPGNSVNPMDGSIPGPPAIVPKVYQPLPVNERAELFRGDWSADGHIPLPPQPPAGDNAPVRMKGMANFSDWSADGRIDLPPQPFSGRTLVEEKPPPPPRQPPPPAIVPESCDNTHAEGEDAVEAEAQEALAGTEIRASQPYDGIEVLENGEVEVGYLVVSAGESLHILAGPEPARPGNQDKEYFYCRRPREATDAEYGWVAARCVR